jgi:hypothetical protein
MTGQAIVAGWTYTVQFIPWWRWNGGLCSPFLDIGFDSFFVSGAAKDGSIFLFFGGSLANKCAEEKSLVEAHNGDVYMRGNP